MINLEQPMTPAQISIVKKTWKIIMSIDASIVGDAFYAKLFAGHSSVKKMFPKDMSLQYQKLLDMLTSIVMRLDNLSEVSQEIADMANRHVGYGVKPAHYAYVGEALLWTLEKTLGNSWTPDVKEAWTTCYQTLAQTMIEAKA